MKFIFAGQYMDDNKKKYYFRHGKGGGAVDRNQIWSQKAANSTSGECGLR